MARSLIGWVTVGDIIGTTERCRETFQVPTYLLAYVHPNAFADINNCKDYGFDTLLEQINKIVLSISNVTITVFFLKHYEGIPVYIYDKNANFKYFWSVCFLG